ncbi:MAG: T9SS type A sorting domain-containing protein [Flavobacteriales bacterium]|jgi:photosystem II stability/assembly factor-like uncharacterized protein|nr:T9SS type A sorting domain-containing protein [Flavobacteriales bacterium]
MNNFRFVSLLIFSLVFQFSDAQLANNPWSDIGPHEVFRKSNNGATLKSVSSLGNISTFSQSISNPNVLYAGSEVGAVFKTIDKGLNWSSIEDHVFDFGAVKSIKIAPSTSAVVYIGFLNKVYKTANGGINWTMVLDVPNDTINAIEIHPSNPNKVFIAGTFGIKKTSDGGNLWDDLATVECWDIKIGTGSSSTLFAAITDTNRNTTYIHRSYDEGNTWSKRWFGWFFPKTGTAKNNFGARIAVTKADTNRIYAILLGDENDFTNDNGFIGIYRSTNGGNSWATPFDGNLNGNPDNQPGGPYFGGHWCFTGSDTNGMRASDGFRSLDIEASDVNEDHLMIGATNLFKSTDGGVTYSLNGGTLCNGCTENNQSINIHQIEMNDQDVWVSSDGGIDLYDTSFVHQSARSKGLNVSEFISFDQGWNHPTLAGGRKNGHLVVHNSGFGDNVYAQIEGRETDFVHIDKVTGNKVYHNIDGTPGLALSNSIQNATSNIENFDKTSNTYPDLLADGTAEVHPLFGHIVYITDNQDLYKSIDGGESFLRVHQFGSLPNRPISSFKMSNVNPDTMFVTQQDSGKTILWRSENGGDDWITIAFQLDDEPHVYLDIDEDDNIFALASTNGLSSAKVLVSSDYGITWSNITHSGLGNDTLIDIEVQKGTNQGVYIASKKDIFYINNNMTVWQKLTDGLPKNFRVNKILPFYSGNKLRVAGNRGIWERNLFEPSQPVSLPITTLINDNCDSLEYRFDDMSTLNHTNATWTWNFPGASKTFGTNQKSARAVYYNGGVYTASLTVSNNFGTSSNSMVDLIKYDDSYCEPLEEPLNALKTNYANEVRCLDHNYDEIISDFTFTGWFKPTSNAFSGTTIFSFRTQADTNLEYRLRIGQGNNIQLTWEDQVFLTNMPYVKNRWNFIAFSVGDTALTIYHNERKQSFNHVNGSFKIKDIALGRNFEFYSFRGLLDEFKFWRKTLTEADIKLNRHLIQTNILTNDLIMYHQFNGIGKGTFYDLKRNFNFEISKNAEMVESDAPVGPGVSFKMNITGPGDFNFLGTGCELKFPTSSPYPDGEIVVSKINIPPSKIPTGMYKISDSYWIINNYGDNESFNKIAKITLRAVPNLSHIPDNTNLKLYQRDRNADKAAAWTKKKDNATSYDVSLNTVVFEDSEINTGGQIFLATLIPGLDIKEILSQDKQGKINIYPNPISQGELLNFDLNDQEVESIQVFDVQGRVVDYQKMNLESPFYNTSKLEKGIYFIQLSTNSKTLFSKVVVQ